MAVTLCKGWQSGSNVHVFFLLLVSLSATIFRQEALSSRLVASYFPCPFAFSIIAGAIFLLYVGAALPPLTKSDRRCYRLRR